MTVLAVFVIADAVVAALFAVSIGVMLLRFHKSAHEGLYDAAAGAHPLRGPR